MKAKTDVKDAVLNPAITEIESHIVYILQSAGSTLNVGRTLNPVARKAYHTAKYDKLYGIQVEFVQVYSGLSKEEARLREQALISAYTLDILKNKAGYGNRIRGIAVNKLGDFTNLFSTIDFFNDRAENEVLDFLRR
ncbi:MAG: hypothetical protein PHT83_05000 [Bacilli bacterium]|nr:hypothetical protein [Bacilli bacterium]